MQWVPEASPTMTGETTGNNAGTIICLRAALGDQIDISWIVGQSFTVHNAFDGLNWRLTSATTAWKATPTP